MASHRVAAWPALAPAYDFRFDLINFILISSYVGVNTPFLDSHENFSIILTCERMGLCLPWMLSTLA